MNLNNFEEKIDSVILERGIDYYLTGHVDKIVTTSENTYTLTILGSRIYKVTVELTNNCTIKSSNCTCPYVGGPICKHQVAAFYALKEDKPSQNKESLADLLDTLDKDALIQLLLNLAERNPDLKNDLLFQLETNPLKQTNQLKQSIKDTIDAYKGPDQFIHYNQSFDFTTELSQYIDRINHVQSPLEAFDMLLFLFEETIKALQYIDDSGGVITGLQIEIQEAIKERLDEEYSLTENEKLNLLENVKTTIDSKTLEDWPETQVELLESFKRLLGEPKVNALYINVIDRQIRLQQTNPYGTYAINLWLLLKSQVMEVTHSKEDYGTFLKENKAYSAIRKKYFDWLLMNEEFERVIKETKKAEEEDETFPGLVNDWREYQYKAFKAMGRVEDQKALAFQFLMIGKYDYYDELKRLEKNHEALYQRVKEGFKQTNSWKAEEAFLKIMLEEEDTEELLAYVQKNPYYVTRFSEVLYPNYPKEVEEAYQIVIKKEAKQASNRKEYKKVCRLIQKYAFQTKNQNKVPIIKKLEESYPHRPAFLDELKKVR